MTAAELLQDYDIEMAMTRRVLERVPDDQPDFRPHAKSMPLGRLAMHVATLPRMCRIVFTTPGFDIAAPRESWPDLTFQSRNHLLEAFDTHLSEARIVVAAASDGNIAAAWKFSFGDHVLSNGPRSLAYRHMGISHLVHHRAQLGVYLRLLDIPVPGVYGPSADEPFKA
jgi:uncharacterized damage-inducible protein DinB